MNDQSTNDANQARFRAIEAEFPEADMIKLGAADNFSKRILAGEFKTADEAFFACYRAELAKASTEFRSRYREQSQEETAIKSYIAERQAREARNKGLA
jgi:hypothetical protein